MTDLRNMLYTHLTIIPNSMLMKYETLLLQTLPGPLATAKTIRGSGKRLLAVFRPGQRIVGGGSVQIREP